MKYIIHIKHLTFKGEHRETGIKHNSSLSDCKSYVKVKHNSLLNDNLNVTTIFSVHNTHISATGEFQNGKLNFLKSEPN